MQVAKIARPSGPEEMGDCPLCQGDGEGLCRYVRNIHYMELVNTDSQITFSDYLLSELQPAHQGATILVHS